ncbi:hypothetical protein QTP88_015157 [Uroleucon formosanum]
MVTMKAELRQNSYIGPTQHEAKRMFVVRMEQKLNIDGLDDSILWSSKYYSAMHYGLTVD